MADDKVRITVIGAPRVGKTALVHSWLKMPFREGHLSETIATETYSKNTSITFQRGEEETEVGVCACVQDFQGCHFEDMDSLSFSDEERIALKNAHCIVVVFDVDANDKKRSFVMADYLAREARHATGERIMISKKRNRSLKKQTPAVPIILVANKDDLERKSYHQATQLAHHLGIEFFATSAKTGHCTSYILTTHWRSDKVRTWTRCFDVRWSLDIRRLQNLWGGQPFWAKRRWCECRMRRLASRAQVHCVTHAYWIFQNIGGEYWSRDNQCQFSTCNKMASVHCALCEKSMCDFCHRTIHGIINNQVPRTDRHIVTKIHPEPDQKVVTGPTLARSNSRKGRIKCTIMWCASQLFQFLYF